MTRRKLLFLLGLLPLLLVTLYAVKVALLLSHDGDGRGAFDDKRYDAAAAEFAGNRSLNVLEPWVAAFDEGAARHAAGDLDDAVDAYTAALRDVPEDEECTVRINLALAHEAIGDAKIQMPDRDAAIEAWQAGIDALEDGDCPEHSGRGEDQTADAKAVDDRLEQKIEEQQPEDQQDQPEQQDQPQNQPQQPEDRDKEQKLEQRNQSSQEERRESEQTDDFGDIKLDGQQW
jgi:cobalamin biosynthesis protein CobT